MQIEIDDLESVHPELINAIGDPSAADSAIDSAERIANTFDEESEGVSDEHSTGSTCDNGKGGHEVSNGVTDSLSDS